MLLAFNKSKNGSLPSDCKITGKINVISNRFLNIGSCGYGSTPGVPLPAQP
jgi:hypothetical protein